MNGGFLVDVTGLGRVIATLTEVTDRMRSANSRLGAVSAADLGSGELDRAAEGFQRRWEYGIGKISDAAETMTDSLREAKQLYEQMDQAIARLFPDPGATGATTDGSDTDEPGEPSSISRALDGTPIR